MSDSVKRPLVPGNGSRAFGGSTVAALLRAAAASSREGQRPHSLHAQFLAPADPSADVRVTTRTLRSSPAFTTVATDLEQGDVVVATGTVSFHRGRESRSHAATGPSPTYSPEAAPSARGGVIPPEDAPSRRGFDFRAADPFPVPGPDGRPVLRYWVRCRNPLATDLEQTSALVWVSDLCLTRVVDLEHETVHGVRLAASLDHAVWFHRRFDLTEWLLYETASPAYSDGLALSTGRFHAGGTIVASVAQQSTLRRVSPR